jgi:hypothetical protein
MQPDRVKASNGEITVTTTRLVAIRFAGILGALGCLASGAVAAELPAQFRGVWTAAQETSNECKRSDWDKHESDAMISVGPNAVDYWEASCKVQSVKKSNESTYEVGLACGGEGMRWRSKEVWQVKRIASRNHLIAVTLERFDERDEAGKRVKGSSQHQVYINVHVECR